MTHNLQSLRQAKNSNAVAEPNQDGVKMMLPGHLNTLLEIYPSKSVLVVDLRSATDFERSHIHDAVNLRAPCSFVENVSLEMIEDTFMDDQSRRSFSRWAQCQCVVFYDRVVEYEWECPAAGALHAKLRSKGWTGQSFILKGHYREFSASFDRYISGAKMSREAKEHLDSLRAGSSLTEEETNSRHRRYDNWLNTVLAEDRVPQRVELIPARKLERRHAVELHQRELESEFETRFPALYRKALAMGKRRDYSPPPTREPSPPPPFESTEGRLFRDVDWDPAGEGEECQREAFDRKAALVEPLVSGLERIRAQHGFASESEADLPAGYGYVSDKLDMDYYPATDDFDEIDPKREGLKNDPAFERAGVGAGSGPGSGTASDDGGSGKKAGGRIGGSKKPKPLWERLRSGKS